MKPRLSIERLRDVLDYDPTSGEFRWRTKAVTKPKCGSLAGSITSQGYRRIIVDKRGFKAHRLAWFYAYEEWPDGDIDHINGIRDDNRLQNLRLATRSQNCANTKLLPCNTSGYKGVSWHSQCRKWMAKIRINKRQVYLGLFDKPELAHAAYMSAARAQHGEFARPF